MPLIWVQFFSVLYLLAIIKMSDKESTSPDKKEEQAGPSANNNNVEEEQQQSKKKKMKTVLTDPWYEFEENTPQKIDGDMIYSPSFFLRTHSKNNNAADVQTQVSPGVVVNGYVNEQFRGGKIWLCCE